MNEYDIKPHPFISRDRFVEIIKVHNGIDAILSLHYSTHQNFLPAHRLFEQVANLIQRTTKIDNLLWVLMVDKFCYKLLSPIGIKKGDYSPCYVAIFGSIKEFNSSLETRKIEFVNRLNQWIIDHQHIDYFNTDSVGDLIALHKKKYDTIYTSTKEGKNLKKSPTKITKNTLKNDASKFRFKQKDEVVEQSKSGLTLLERIQLKEKLNKETNQQETPEQKRELFLNSKLTTLYNILFQLNGDTEVFKTFALTNIMATIKDSLNYPIHDDEIFDCLKLMSTKLKKITILKRDELTVVKLYKFNRTEDLKCLN